MHLSLCCCSVAKSCLPMNCSTPGFPVLYCLLEFAQSHVYCLVMPSNHFILCHLLHLLPLVFPSIRVFSSESALLIRWPNYWSLLYLKKKKKKIYIYICMYIYFVKIILAWSIFMYYLWITGGGENSFHDAHNVCLLFFSLSLLPFQVLLILYLAR